MLRVTAAALAVGLIATACDRADEPPTPFNRGLAASGLALPTPRVKADLGILQDQKTYAPATPAGGLSGRVDARDARGQVEQFVARLLEASNQHNIPALLEMFNPEHIQALKDAPEALFATDGLVQGLYNVISSKLGPEVVEQIRSVERQATLNALRIEIQGAANATVTPNLTAGLLGPKATPAMILAKSGDKWLIQLDAPLSAADVSAINAFHGMVQAAITALTEQVESGAITTAEQLAQVLGGAASGQGAGGPSVPPAPVDSAAPAPTEPRAAETPAPPPDQPAGDQPSRPRDRRQPEPEPEPKSEPTTP